MLHYKLQAGCMIILLYIGFVYWHNNRQAAIKRKWKVFDRILILGILCLIC